MINTTLIKLDLCRDDKIECERERERERENNDMVKPNKTKI